MTLYGAIEEDVEIQNLLVKAMFVQQTDITYYDSVDFDDFKSTLSYFKKLFLSFTPDAEKGEESFENLMTLVRNRKIEGLSRESADAKVLQVMRTAAEKIHDAFGEMDGDFESIVDIARLVSHAKDVALNGLIDLMYEDESVKDFNVQYRDLNKMDVGVSKEYEVLE